jgi:hypothetical protein
MEVTTMGLFSKSPAEKEVRGFGRGQRSSAKAAEAYAQKARDRAATKAAMKERAAAQRRAKK